MKKMKTTIAATVALCATVALTANASAVTTTSGNVKEGTITFALTGQRQVSVSETTGNNVGDWVDPVTGRGPTHYKTGAARWTQADLIKCIGETLYGDPSYYGKSAKLVLVQGELSGFFVATSDLGFSTTPDVNTNSMLTGFMNSADADMSTSIGQGTDSLFAMLATGRHFDVNPLNEKYPIGHLQPWGQIYIKYTVGRTNYCDNVTPFFGITVQECYDCFYMNSFISDSTFTFKSTKTAGTQNGPPCCSTPSSTNTVMYGSGRDRYYMTLSFDDTDNNPYLNPTDYNYLGTPGIVPTVGATDGIMPDGIDYFNVISSGVGQPSPYEARFTLNGILAYNWTLKFVNTSDLAPDFVGSASYAANGYGFIQLYCTLLTGTMNINEAIIKSGLCCAEETSTYWSDWWYGVGNYNGVFARAGSYDSLNQNLYFNWINYTPSTPFNTAANLSYHANFNEEYTPWEVEQEYQASLF